MKQFENVYYFFSDMEFKPSKFLKDIFINKMEEPVESDNSAIQKPVVIDVDVDVGTKKEFTFSFKGLDYDCSYCSKRLDADKKVYKVSIILNYSSRKEHAAHAFSDLVRTIKVNKKSDFNMVVINDSLSTYYSERLYSKLAFYERSMRALITAIFIPMYKETWAEKLKDSLDKEIKGNKREVLEGLLETLDLSDLESIFFDKKLIVDVDNYDSKFEVHIIESLPKEELIRKIRRNRPVSLWEKEISKYAFIENAQVRMEKIRGLRNKIAHNKSFTDKNFLDLKKELDLIIPKLNEAENKILGARDNEVLKQTIKRLNEKLVEINFKNIVPDFSAIEKIRTALQQSVSKEIINFTKHLNRQSQIMNNIFKTPLAKTFNLWEVESEEEDIDPEE